ncbi:MAG: Rpn family recombination-promoting nuclease/putative transposase [Bacteroidota bacterium]
MSAEGIEPQGRGLSHDRLFKSLLERFLPEFVCLFLPNVADKLDMSRVTFLQQELLGDRRKVVDILAEVKLAGSGEPVLIHVEVQATPESGFARRMYTYYAGITQRHSHRVVPIAIYLFATKAYEHPRKATSGDDKCAADACQLESWVEYGVEIETLRFNFHAVHLRRIGWRELAGIGNPVALPVALALLGVAAGSLQDATERVQVAIAFYRGLVRTVNEPQDRQLLTAFFKRTCT